MNEHKKRPIEHYRKMGRKSKSRSPWGTAPMVSTDRNAARHRRMYGEE